MSTLRIDMTVREAQEYVALQLQRASLNVRLRNLERIRKSLFEALCAQAADTNVLNFSALAAANHYSTIITPKLRHVSIEYAHLPSGWLVGPAAIRSYHNLSQLYWKRTFHIKQQSIFLDPATMSITLVSENHWEWRDGRRGGPWIEIAETRQTYDRNFKIQTAEYVTLSGRSTNCWLMGYSANESSGSSGIVEVKTETDVDAEDDESSTRGREALDTLFFD